ncbi:MAG TPA: hypothetical protein VGB54_03455 [Allosphingosinicella sp.]|jgi:hypothetical protein
MAIRWRLATIAALMAGACGLSACNLADRSDDRDTAARGRDERPDRERRERAPEREPERDSVASDEPGPRAQLASSTRSDPAGISRDWFAGRWTDTGDCADAGEFRPDGTFQLADGSRGMWNIREGRLVVQGQAGRNALQLRRTGDTAVEVLNSDGSVGRSIRC